MAGSFAERLVAAIAGTHAVIDLDAFAGNVEQIRQCVQRLGQHDLMAIVKANAYGHGMVMCARTAIEAGATWLGVSRIEEAILLRDHGIQAPILALGPFNSMLITAAARNNIAITIGSTEGLERIRPALEALESGSLEVHLKIDTGMHRYGVRPAEAPDLARELQEEPAVRYSGILTHFATADAADDTFFEEQQRRFVETIHQLLPEGLVPSLIHMNNSAAVIRSTLPPELHGFTTMSRPGLALYGLSPSEHVPVPAGFRRVMTLKTRLGRIFRLEPGEGVSYGLTHVAQAPTLCATVPVGYGDGLNRHLSNQGWMSVKGRRCPIIGRVCMDQTVIDITTVSHPEEGDEAIVLGDGSGYSMTADQAAEIIGTLNYEVTAAVLPRIPRSYIRDEAVIAVEDISGLIEK